MSTINPKAVIRFLNYWLDKDEVAVTNLVDHETTCSPDLAADRRFDTSVVQAAQTIEGEDGDTIVPEVRAVSVMALINGMFGGKRIGVVRDHETNRIIRFEEATP